MALTVTEREQFLSEPHIAALSVEAEPGRAPLTVPIWYQYTPGERPWLLTGTESRKLGLIRAAGRFTLMVERVEPTIRYASVSGDVVGYDDATRDDLWEMAARYLPEEKVGPYVDFAWDNHGPQTRVTLEPRQWVSLDLGSV
ncbi:MULTISPECIES: pyridoxamine 5'-phosphate oxidase family protein [unclassified Gordonia (in: high G+C Gram-positive bacteria)]|uniref:pyridoxamine 5'-phosphate oxidase family protein n=1 Tax=unclassified Gordonia (in: high G+C Gram-positive bacteria) TaxID=2657482 RepID=UPI001F0FCBF6|nr:pyridoxamine 5'-phosphate oxidase family protein [Gordonia sp. ABSL49_1]MCH5645364.1 pyridoxamine 5'-phosphate oxidase family protein [Gordonia sp. ABSL49_1]